MEENKKKIWFPSMKYGVGWGLPITWQGWAVLLAYMLLMIVGSVFLTSSPSRLAFFPAYVMCLTAFLIFICWKKGEKLSLRWGDKKHS
jgi:asparagine N-glycosylation enzyme membrane subunit Stt3